MSKRPPQSIEELKSWIDSNTHLGKINDEPIIKTGTTEFRHGIVPGDLYDLALLRAAPFSFTKSDIAAQGATRLLSNAVIVGIGQQWITPEDSRKGTEFRAYLPTGLYQLLQQRKEKFGLTNSQAMTMILVYYACDPGIERLYQDWVRGTATTLGVSVGKVEQAVFDYCKYQARLKRYDLSVKKGEFVSDRKVAT